jgi:integrase
MEQMSARSRASSRATYTTVFKSAFFDRLRHKCLLETTADDFLVLFKDGRVSLIFFLKCLHNFALSLGWLAMPIIAPKIWPKYRAKERRGITLEEHQIILAKGHHAEWKLYLELLWETGAAQADAAHLQVENLDWPMRTLSYFRMKTGTLAQFTISKKLATVLSHLPTTGPLFPYLSRLTSNGRANWFRRVSRQAGLKDLSLHCYRYAWAERAKMAGMPERFAQAALGHNSQAIHRAYAKKALVIAPSLEDYENQAKALPPTVTA